MQYYAKQRYCDWLPLKKRWSQVNVVNPGMTNIKFTSFCILAQAVTVCLYQLEHVKIYPLAVLWLTVFVFVTSVFFL